VAGSIHHIICGHFQRAASLISVASYTALYGIIQHHIESKETTSTPRIAGIWSLSARGATNSTTGRYTYNNAFVFVCGLLSTVAVCSAL
jgi:hypothetical protein